MAQSIAPQWSAGAGVRSASPSHARNVTVLNTSVMCGLLTTSHSKVGMHCESFFVLICVTLCSSCKWTIGRELWKSGAKDWLPGFQDHSQGEEGSVVFNRTIANQYFEKTLTMSCKSNFSIKAFRVIEYLWISINDKCQLKVKRQDSIFPLMFTISFDIIKHPFNRQLN